jgi:predicted tellurium resistance membrane protein TerC
MHWISDPQIWIALVTLTAMEIVLGIDNIIFISILAGKLPAEQRGRARVLGLAMAMITRIALLLSITWIMRLTAPLFGLGGHEFSGRDLILIAGGLFLLYKSTHEIHEKLEGDPEHLGSGKAHSFLGVIFTIAVLDIVFSIDSVVTAVGMTQHVPVMIAAIIIAVGVMMLSSGPISDFVHRHPTIKMLALSFLLLIGVTLIADGLGRHIEKGYIYFAMAFSVFVEMLNLRMKKKHAAAGHAVTPPAK